ncbi:MAG: hypothetical protein IH608_02820, partial [Proteobacteria bacterium]|nr:hypothetical protein [Pseudomonadota bacterium]
HWGAVTPRERRAELDQVLAAVRRVLDQEWVHPDLGGDPDPGRRSGAEGMGGEGEEEPW